ncbi:MAG: hypothetical protein R3185_00855 [Candidatus Thermoplasmatota archaeon]|nr:hypothetical protein [Candidatus Thermoplasmatota archaeon]
MLRRSVLYLVTLSLLMASLAGAAVAAGPPGEEGCSLFGMRVGATDGDLNSFVDFLGDETWFVDHDLDGARDAGEDVLLDLDQDNQVSPGDLRLSGAMAGSWVGQGDADLGQELDRADGELHYLDADGDGHLDHDEGVLLDMDQDATLSTPDLVLSDGIPGVAAGESIPPGHGSEGASLEELWSGAFSFIDADGDGWPSLGDTVLLDVQGDWVVSVGDVRLSGTPTDLTAAPVVQAAPAGATPHLTAELTAETGEPLSGRLVLFFAQDTFLCSALTDAQGVARCGDTLDLALAGNGYTAIFQGGPPYCGSSGTAPGLLALGTS